MHPRALLLALISLPAVASGQALTNDDVVHDDQRGRWTNWNLSPSTAVHFAADSSFFWVLNQPGSRLAAFSTDDLEKLLDIPTGPGLVSLAARPDAPELWCVDAVTASVTVVDAIQGAVVRTIPVGAGPRDLTFTESGDRAYVACSDAGRVDVIRTLDYEVVNSIAIPAKDPRAVERMGDAVFVASFTSGNGTAPIGQPGSLGVGASATVERVADHPGANPLPDRDLFVIRIGPSPATDSLDETATRTGLGTTLFDVRRRPGTAELWIPNTDALNADFRGERNFRSGQVVENRITVLDYAQGGEMTVIPLDGAGPSKAHNCAPPTGVAFTSDGSRAFVCGYGSNLVTVLDAAGSPVRWKGTISIRQRRTSPSVSTTPEQNGAGPRVCAVSPDDEWLIVVNSGENSLTRVPLAQLPNNPFGWTYSADTAVPIGWDPTPLEIVQGRLDFARTKNSKSVTSSCASCHVDGHTDGLAWDLGRYLDPEGTPAADLSFPLDAKGPLVTQTTRRMREVGPWHWRGERAALAQFDGTFVNLLEAEGLGIQFNYIERYMDTLAWPANHRQSKDRLYDTEELEGATLFIKEHLEGLACEYCHTLPIGTGGEIVPNSAGGIAPTTVAPSLRGVAEKLTPAYDVGGDFGTRTELGAGLGHSGRHPSFQSFLLEPLPPPLVGQHFDLSPAEADQIASFLEALDTGLAPATAFQVTLHAGNALAAAADEVAYLESQAEAGNCDVVYRFKSGSSEAPLYLTGLFDPVLGAYRQGSAALPPLSTSRLVDLALGGTPVTLVGVPLDSGQPMGIDRDNDELLDLDELVHGTNPEGPDSDQDGLPDGWEVERGLDPLAWNYPPASDTTAPSWLAPPTVVYATLHTVKFEFDTDEIARASVSYDGGPVVLRAPLKPTFDHRFSLILNGLEPYRTYDVRVDLSDPAGNVSTQSFPVTTAARILPEPVYIADVSLTVVGGPTNLLHAQVTLERENGFPAIGYNLVANVYHDSQFGPEMVAEGVQTWMVQPNGVANFYVSIPNSVPQNIGELVFVVRECVAPAGAVPFVRGEGIDPFTAVDY